LFKKFKKASAAQRLIEEKLYEKVLQEIDNDQIRNGLWAKALANSNGIDGKAKALYIQYRVQSIKDEAELFDAVADEPERLARIDIQENAKSVKVREVEVFFMDHIEKFGYKLIQNKDRDEMWAIHYPNGTGIKYTYSLDDLMTELSKIVKQNTL